MATVFFFLCPKQLRKVIDAIILSSTKYSGVCTCVRTSIDIYSFGRKHKEHWHHCAWFIEKHFGGEISDRKKLPGSFGQVQTQKADVNFGKNVKKVRKNYYRTWQSQKWVLFIWVRFRILKGLYEILKLNKGIKRIFKRIPW